MDKLIIFSEKLELSIAPQNSKKKRDSRFFGTPSKLCFQSLETSEKDPILNKKKILHCKCAGLQSAVDLRVLWNIYRDSFELL